MQTDRDLLQQALRGDVRAFETLVERHFGLVYTVAYARLRDPEITEDLAQEVMLRAYLHLERLGPGGSFPAWVARIARNLAIDWQRRGQRASRLLPQVPLDAAALSAPDPTVKGAHETMSKREESEALRSALFDLPDADRELVLLHFTEGLSQSEIAERLGTTQATISRRLRAALGKLRGQLEPMLREVAPTLRAPQRAVVRSVTFIVATSALSATAKAGLMAAAPATEIASATSAAKAGVVGAFGAVGFLQSLPALIAGGAKIMATGKGITAAVVAVGAITAGGVYLGTNSDHETALETAAPAIHIEGEGFSIQTSRMQVGEGFDWDVSAVMTGPENNDTHFALTPVPGDVAGRLFDLSGDFTAAAREFLTQTETTLPRTPGLRFHVPFPGSGSATLGVNIHSYDIAHGSHSEYGVEVTPLAGGEWDITLPRMPSGDLLVLDIDSSRTDDPDVWAVRLEGEYAPFIVFPEDSGVYAMTSDARLITLSGFTVGELEARGERENTGEDFGSLIAELDLPSIPRDAHLLICGPSEDMGDFDPAQGGRYEFNQLNIDDRGVTQLGVALRGIPGRRDLMEVTFTEPVVGDLLGVMPATAADPTAMAWLARFEGDPHAAAASAAPTEGVFALDSRGRDWIALPQFTFEEMDRLQDRMQSGEDAAALLAELRLPRIGRDLELTINLPGLTEVGTSGTPRGFDLDQIVLEDMSHPSLGATWSQVPGQPGIWRVTTSAPVVGDVLGIECDRPDRSEQMIWLGAFDGPPPAVRRVPLAEARPQSVQQIIDGRTMAVYRENVRLGEVQRFELGPEGRAVLVLPEASHLWEVDLAPLNGMMYLALDVHDPNSGGLLRAGLQGTRLHLGQMIVPISPPATVAATWDLANGESELGGMTVRIVADENEGYNRALDDLDSRLNRGEITPEEWVHERDALIQRTWPELGWKTSGQISGTR